MKRRSFLKSIGAAALSPMIPLPSLASMGSIAPSIAPAVVPATYKWAEMIARAHRTCNIAMLQRHLRLDAATASMVQKQLVANGVIGAQANIYGTHQAIKPLFEGAFPKPANVGEAVKSTVEKAREFVGKIPVDDRTDGKKEAQMNETILTEHQMTEPGQAEVLIQTDLLEPMHEEKTFCILEDRPFKNRWANRIPKRFETTIRNSDDQDSAQQN